jgi:hypothetical protein
MDVERLAAAKSPIRASIEGFCDRCRRIRTSRLRIASADRAYWGRDGAYSWRHGSFVRLALAAKSVRANIGSLASRTSLCAPGRRREFENHPWVASSRLHRLVDY